MRICHFCQSEVPSRQSCRACETAFPNRRPVNEMTAQERAQELLAWGGVVEIPFHLVHKRIEELVGRSVWTHEMAQLDMLVDEILAGEPASLSDVLNKVPSEKTIVVVVEP